MAYIGAQPRLGNFQACDAITASATTTFNLLVGGTAIFPQSAQHCLVSLNGVLQAPISSYTISGSTIVFASALTSADSIDFITILGDTLDLGTPSDSTVTTAKLNTAVLTGATDIGAAIADADLFLVDDGAGGTLRKTAASRIKTYVGGTNAPYFEAYIASNQTMADDTDTKLNFDTETYDSGGMYNTTNKRFTPTVAGKYFIYFQVNYNKQAVDKFHNCVTRIKRNGSTHKEFYFDFYDNYYAYAICTTGSAIMTFNGSSDYVEMFGSFNVTADTGIVISGAGSTFGGYKITE